MASGDDLKELRELVEFLKANDIAEFEMERDDLKVALKFANAVVHPAPGVDPATLAGILASQTVASAPVAAAAPALPAPVAAPAVVHAAAAPAAAAAPEDGAHIVKSPIVGTFYAASSPGADAFTKVGDQVSVGKVLCIVEAMKLMNEIESDAAGEVVKIFVKDGQPVEYGQPLFAVK
jgi:acetyl-CoA carboxylase biotin carboxyl carrier protein